MKFGSGGFGVRLPVLAVTVALVFAGCEKSVVSTGNPQSKQTSCVLPFEVNPTEKPKAGLTVYIDSSLSMAGYARGEGSVAVGDLFDSIKQFTSLNSSLGSVKIEPFSEIPSAAPETSFDRWVSPDAYTGRVSRIDAVLDQIERSPDSGGLNLIYTDLWLDHESIKGSPEGALGGRFSALVGAGRSVAILGLMVPYQGAIMGYRGVAKRPLYLIAIGTDRAVTNITAFIHASKSPALKAMHGAIFHAKATDDRRPAIRATAGFDLSLLPKEPSDLGKYAVQREKARSGGELSFDASPADRIPTDAVWKGVELKRARVWLLQDRSEGSCEWVPRTDLPRSVWGKTDSHGAVKFQLTAANTAQLANGSTYLIAAELGSTSIDPNLNAAVLEPLRQWSGPSDVLSLRGLLAKRPREFPTPGLNGVIDGLVGGVRGETIVYRAPILLSVKD